VLVLSLKPHETKNTPCTNAPPRSLKPYSSTPVPWRGRTERRISCDMCVQGNRHVDLLPYAYARAQPNHTCHLQAFRPRRRRGSHRFYAAHAAHKSFASRPQPSCGYHPHKRLGTAASRAITSCANPSWGTTPARGFIQLGRREREF
jgi:hypothetical protein